MNLNRAGFVSALAALAAQGVCRVPAFAQSGGDNPTTGIGEDAVLALARKPARHRQVFAATRPSGNVFAYVRNSLNGYAFGWHEGPGTLHPIVVFNGLGVAQGVDDAAWQQYGIADVLARNGATLRAAGPGNPWLHAPANLAADMSAQTTGFAMDTSIESLGRRGTDWLVCDTAMITLALAIAGARGLDAGAVHRDLRGHLVAGAQLVPSGAAAMDALEAEHFTYYDANV